MAAVDAFRYDFTPRELAYFLFGKHVCPCCNHKLSRTKSSRVVPGCEFNSRSAAPFHEHARVLYYTYSYSCPACNREFNLSELATKKLSAFD